MRSLMIHPNRVARELDSMFSNFWNGSNLGAQYDCDFMPRVNIRESKDDVLLTFEVPGMNREDIKVTVKENVLTVSGERKEVVEENEQHYVRNEILTGSFSRSFTLPESVDTEKITADYKQGMLAVKLAKKEAVKPKEIEVSVA